MFDGDVQAVALGVFQMQEVPADPLQGQRLDTQVASDAVLEVDHQVSGLQLVHADQASPVHAPAGPAGPPLADDFPVGQEDQVAIRKIYPESLRGRSLGQKDLAGSQ